MAILRIVFGGFLIIGVGSIIFFVFVRSKEIINAEQLKKQRNILLSGILIYFLVGIVAGIMASYPALLGNLILFPSIGAAVILLGIWLLCYGFRHIYLLILFKVFGVSYFVIILFWLLALFLLLNAFLTKFHSLGWI